MADAVGNGGKESVIGVPVFGVGVNHEAIQDRIIVSNARHHFSASQPAAWSFGITNFLHVSASFGIFITQFVT